MGFCLEPLPIITIVWINIDDGYFYIILIELMFWVILWEKQCKRWKDIEFNGKTRFFWRKN